MSNIVIDF